MKKFPRIALTLFALHVSLLSSHAAVPQSADWKRYVIAHPDVVFPEVIKRTGMQGLGVFLLVIDRKDGTVTEVKVLKSTGYKKLDAIYVMNFFQWRFQPGTIAWARIPRGVHVTGRANIYHDAR
ncbi:MAG: Gram-negative bacterial TonB protein C-terminal [Verrucomicrobiota bacterium]|jgi:TonB family protein